MKVLFDRVAGKSHREVGKLIYNKGLQETAKSEEIAAELKNCRQAGISPCETQTWKEKHSEVS